MCPALVHESLMQKTAPSSTRASERENALLFNKTRLGRDMEKREEARTTSLRGGSCDRHLSCPPPPPPPTNSVVLPVDRLIPRSPELCQELLLLPLLLLLPCAPLNFPIPRLANGGDAPTTRSRLAAPINNGLIRSVGVGIGLG
jgi:hypothetical protein